MVDRRSLETREKIEKNFISLLEKRSIENITITEITKLAGINRRTFYVYYEDIYDLRNQIEKKILEDFSEVISDYPEADTITNYFRYIFKYLSENINTFEALSKNLQFSLISNMMKSTFHDTNEVLQLKDGIEAQRALNFVCWGVIGFLEDNSHQFEEKDVEQLTTMVSNTLMPYLDL